MKNILVALDDTEESKSVLARAIELALPTSAEITLLHVVDIPVSLPSPSSMLIRTPASASELVAVARAHLVWLAQSVPAPLRGEVLVGRGNPASTICKVAEERAPDLVVIGAHRHGILRKALGTTAAHVVDNVEGAVLVVRTRAASAGDERVSQALRSEHQRLDGVYVRLAQSCADDGDWADVQAGWIAFERALRAHMTHEEQHFLPAFERADPVETKCLMGEHVELRRILSTLGVAVELHAVRKAQIDELLTRLRAHAAREEQLFYPWLDANPHHVRGNGAPDRHQHVRFIEPELLLQELRSDRPVHVVDIRTAAEYTAGHIDCAGRLGGGVRVLDRVHT